jgi:hypothetical protein
MTTEPRDVWVTVIETFDMPEITVHDSEESAVRSLAASIDRALWMRFARSVAEDGEPVPDYDTATPEAILAFYFGEPEDTDTGRRWGFEQDVTREIRRLTVQTGEAREPNGGRTPTKKPGPWDFEPTDPIYSDAWGNL